MKIKLVTEESKASLVRESVARDLMPELKANRLNKGIQIVFAENANTPLELIKAFQNCVYAGVTPPANVLIKMAENIARYFEGNGNIDFDRAFELHSKQKVGHPLNYQKIKQKRGEILHLIYQKRKLAETEGKSISIETAASVVINEYNLSDSEDALCKAYSTLDIDTVFNRAYEVVIETLNSTK
jgi:hypothetical protein